MMILHKTDNTIFILVGYDTACLLGYDSVYWDMTLLTGILYCLLGYDISLWDMTLLTGI